MPAGTVTGSDQFSEPGRERQSVAPPGKPGWSWSKIEGREADLVQGWLFGADLPRLLQRGLGVMVLGGLGAAGTSGRQC